MRTGRVRPACRSRQDIRTLRACTCSRQEMDNWFGRPCWARPSAQWWTGIDEHNCAGNETIGKHLCPEHDHIPVLLLCFPPDRALYIKKDLSTNWIYTKLNIVLNWDRVIKKINNNCRFLAPLCCSWQIMAGLNFLQYRSLCTWRVMWWIANKHTTWLSSSTR